MATGVLSKKEMSDWDDCGTKRTTCALRLTPNPRDPVKYTWDNVKITCTRVRRTTCCMISSTGTSDMQGVSESGSQLYSLSSCTFPSCMELGISPLVTSGLVIQLLVGSKIIDVDTSVKEDRLLMEGAQKFVGLLITVGQAVAYVVSGMYGSVGDLGLAWFADSTQ